jgi:predicted transport protein
MPKSPKEMIAAVVDNLPTKTGRSLEQWATLVKKEGLADQKAMIAWLKTEHGIGTVTAHFIAAEALGKSVVDAYADEGALLDAMYGGERAGLRRLYERLAETAGKLGEDVEMTVCKTFVGLRRKSQFAMIRPTDKGRVDLGLALPKVKPEGRLVKAGSIGNDRMTHRIEITAVKEIDGDVRRWLKAAYELAG